VFGPVEARQAGAEAFDLVGEAVVHGLAAAGGAVDGANGTTDAPDEAVDGATGAVAVP